MNKVISSFINKCNLFSLGQQSDSQRFYRNFLIILEKEIGPQNTCVRNTFVGTIENSNIYYCPDIFCRQNRNKIQYNNNFMIGYSLSRQNISIRRFVKKNL